MGYYERLTPRERQHMVATQFDALDLNQQRQLLMAIYKDRNNNPEYLRQRDTVFQTSKELQYRIDLEHTISAYQSHGPTLWGAVRPVTQAYYYIRPTDDIVGEESDEETEEVYDIWGKVNEHHELTFSGFTQAFQKEDILGERSLIAHMYVGMIGSAGFDLDHNLDFSSSPLLFVAADLKLVKLQRRKQTIPALQLQDPASLVSEVYQNYHLYMVPTEWRYHEDIQRDIQTKMAAIETIFCDLPIIQ